MSGVNSLVGLFLEKNRYLPFGTMPVYAVGQEAIDKVLREHFSRENCVIELLQPPLVIHGVSYVKSVSERQSKVFNDSADYVFQRFRTCQPSEEPLKTHYGNLLLLTSSTTEVHPTNFTNKQY
jgi:hypothetical protein